MDRQDVALQFDQIEEAARLGGESVRAGDDDAALNRLETVSERHHGCAVDLGALMAEEPEPPPDPDKAVYDFDFMATTEKPSWSVDIVIPEGREVERIVCEMTRTGAIKPKQTVSQLVPKHGKKPWKRRLWHLVTRPQWQIKLATDLDEMEVSHGLSNEPTSVRWEPSGSARFQGGISAAEIDAPGDDGMPCRFRIGNGADDDGEPLPGEALSVDVHHVGKLSVYFKPLA